jgi:transcriptional regulator with XRE-family HTH domain
LGILSEENYMGNVKSFGSRLREARESRGLSLKELAERTEAHVSNMSCYETGKRIPSLELFVRIATVLGVSADYLLGSIEEEGVLFDEEVRSIMRDLQALSPRDREAVSGLIRSLSRK